MQIDDDVIWSAGDGEVAVEIREIRRTVPRHLNEFGSLGQPAELAAGSAIDLAEAEPTGGDGRVRPDPFVEVRNLPHLDGVRGGWHRMVTHKALLDVQSS